MLDRVKNMSTGQKVALGVGAAAVVGGAVATTVAFVKGGKIAKLNADEFTKFINEEKQGDKLVHKAVKNVSASDIKDGKLPFFKRLKVGFIDMGRGIKGIFVKVPNAEEKAPEAGKAPEAPEAGKAPEASAPETPVEQ